ncbi:60S ribosomal protein L31-like [Choloepus didactylus]|uniref:60S ribosomal protein L31-like n=1 Tax=Choloepus didactylus TaxID=27675 RepID=UPI00189E207A|nr:60S ribosomal protein L31-like [Choloepus didactylus]
MAPTKKGGEKGHSAINKVLTREYNINIYKCIQGVDFKKCASREFKEIWKFAMEEAGMPDRYTATRLNKDIWAKGIRNVPHHIHVWLSRKCNGDEDSPNKLYTMVTCVPVTTFKNPQTVMWITGVLCNSESKLEKESHRDQPEAGVNNLEKIEDITMYTAT